MKIGIIKEGKIPHEDRTPFSPSQCRQMQHEPFSNTVLVQSYKYRCYSDEEYRKAGLNIENNVDECDVFFGVKEVPIDLLIPGKTYFCFSHTIKKQEHNRTLLQEILKRKIRLIDYELITDDNGRRLTAFGKFAGICGAYNSIWTYGRRTGLFTLPRLKEYKHYHDVLPVYKQIQWPPMKIVLTGHGRVGKGAIQVLADMGFTQVSPSDFLKIKKTDQPIFTALSSADYIRPIDSNKAFQKSEYYANPKHFRSDFLPYLAIADIFINGIYWDIRAPKYFELSDISRPDFNVSVIGDITCDIAPHASVPTTFRASSIDDPVYGVSRKTLSETKAYESDSVDIMAIDNVANELPRDASKYFGDRLLKYIIPELNNMDNSPIIQRAMITENGKLKENFMYLNDYVHGRE
jgi:alanine dehydrogenase